MSSAGPKTDSPQQSDALLWLGGALIVGLGATWLLLSQDWLGGGSDFEPPTMVSPTTGSPTTVSQAPQRDSRPSQLASQPSQPAAQAAAPASQASPPAGRPAAAGAQSISTDLETSLEQNPLRMAELAFEAGMLVEPEEYSAWTLYTRALELDPESEAARGGLEKIAGELLKRANVAVEQGRFDDALATVQRVRSAIPAHPGANDLVFRIDALRPKPATDAETRQALAEPETSAESVARAEPTPRPASAARAAAPAVDRLAGPYGSFGEALARNRLLTPADESAKHFLDVMISLDANHELTREALKRFSDELLSRANAAIIELDAAAAGTWLDEADRLGLNAVPVADARERLRRRLIDTESARRVPVSALVIEHYVPPVFPTRALERSLEGWVDLDFIVGRDGAAREITVTDASHNSFFRREAIEAVEQWRFQPRVFMDEAIEQRAYARIRFTFDEQR